MKILIIDDEVAVLNQFKDAIELWNVDNPTDAFDAPDFVQDLTDARNKIDSSAFVQYDGVVIDLRFKDRIEGDKLLELINQRSLRVPVVVYTGTPDSVKGFCFKVCTKGEVNADGILTWFSDVKMSGLMAVLGMQGSIERTLQDVFCRFQDKSLARWAELGRSCGVDVAERSALRYILMHLLDLLYCSDGKVFPDEMYLNVDKTRDFKTGDIISTTGEKGVEYYLVMSPACDLVVRKTGTPKTESVLLVGIVSTVEAASRGLSDKLALWKKQGETEETCRRNTENFLKKFREQKALEYVHLVPMIKDMPMQYVAFRKVLHLPYEKVDKEFARTGFRIAPPFMKDIQARFASYYSRQGQPDIDYSLEYGIK